MLRIRRFLSLVLIFTCFISIISCDKRPKLCISETDGYYLHTNVNYGKNERHYLDIAIPKADTVPEGMMLYIHGGGWVGGYKEVYSDYLIKDAERGYVAATINYRYANGKSVACEDILDDIELALNCIKNTCKEYGIDVNKVMLSGGSAGGHLSLMFAYTRADTSAVKPVAVASYAGPTNLKDENFYTTKHVEDVKKMISKISGTDLLNNGVNECAEKLDLASPLFYVSEGAVPTLIFHGLKDDVVPYSNAIALYEALGLSGVRAEMVTFENSGHGLESDPEKWKRTEELVFEFMKTYL